MVLAAGYSTKWSNTIFLVNFSGAIDAPSFPVFRFTEEPEDTVVVRNEPATLNCVATLSSYSQPTIRWKRNGAFLSFPDFNDRRYMSFLNV